MLFEPLPKGKNWPHTAWWWPNNLFQALVLFVAFMLVDLLITTPILRALDVSFVTGLFILFVTGTPVWAVCAHFIMLGNQEDIPPELPLTNPPSEVRAQLHASLLKTVSTKNLPLPPREVLTLLLDTGEEMYKQAPHEAVARAIDKSLTEFLVKLPKLEDTAVKVPFSQHNHASTIFNMIDPWRSEEIKALNLPNNPNNAFHANVVRVMEMQGARDLVYPQYYKGNDAVDQYLRGTPFHHLFQIKVPYKID